MKTTTIVKNISFVLSLLVAPSVMAANTADYYKCVNREGGEWNFGRAPQVCSASSFGSDSYLNKNFSILIFQDTAGRTAERNRYMGEMHALVKEAATIYIKKKKPTVSAAEVNAFVEGIVSTAAHESYFSMYRKTSDARLKMMRGDFGHGHGLMQIDDRAHFNAVSTGIAWNLSTHLTYAMDIYYSAWQNAASQSCVTGASNYWQARVRSAWAAYNGGPSKLCRWTNSGDRWAANDKNFYSILTGKKWKTYVANENQKTSIPIQCLMEKKEDCAPVSPETPNKPLEGRLYRVEDQVCLVKNQIFFCSAERDRQCLAAVGTISSQTVISWTKEQVSKYAVQKQDRHIMCADYDKQLIAASSGLKVNKNINMRDTPAGGLLTTIPKGTVLHVRDFEVREVAGDRYYKVNYGGKQGFIYAGTIADALTWASAVSSVGAVKSNMARLNDQVKIVNAYGINLRSTPGGTLVSNIPKGAVVKIQESVVRGEEDKLYYKVTYGKYVGYIYVGMLSTEDSLAAWAAVL